MVNFELNGYPEDAAVPEYRILIVEVKGNVTNGLYSYNDQALKSYYDW
jgi:hypothetical protein